MKETQRIAAEKDAAAARRLRRLALDLRLEDVAVVVGVDASQVHRWERGKAIPKNRHLLAWEEALLELEARG